MSSYPDAEVLNLIKELILKLTNFKIGSNLFNHVEKYVINCVHNADSMVFLKKQDIDQAIASLSEKFMFHGFSIQANDLVRHYNNFLPNTTPKNQYESKLNTIKFLLCLSESPTAKFLENSEGYSRIEYEEEIDWPTYLKEGIERWSPLPTDSSDSWTDDSKSDRSCSPCPSPSDNNAKQIPRNEIAIIEPNLVDYNCGSNTLFDLVQYGWFNKESVHMNPESTNIDANVANCWNDFVEYSVKGLIPLKRTSIISEYCVLREILWQCCTEHNSTTYHFVGNHLLPKEDITIASVRPVALNTYLHEFLPYIELLQEFRNFDVSLNDDDEFQQAPDTYRSYNKSLWNFIRPMFKELVNLEREILAQNTTITLLILAREFRKLFHNAFILQEIHKNAILDFNSNDPLTCTTTLLTRLRIGLLHCISKTELDIYLTLYLESLFKYFHVISTWLGNDTLIDVCNEFIIKQVYNVPNVTNNVTYFNVTDILEDRLMDYEDFNLTMGFVVRDLSDICKDDSVFQIILTNVLQIGKNIHFLRLLKKLYLLGDTLSTESLHEELINRVVNEIKLYFKHDEENTENAIVPSNEELAYKFPAICPDVCKYPTEMDKLENLVDISDGFLMNAFETFFMEQPKEESSERETLYERISKVTTTIYPAKQIIDRVFAQILRERYSESGYLVKNLLIVDFQMHKHFELLEHLFLFKDDMIFPLYRRLFEQMVDYKRVDNDVWLTTQLHDIMIDMYPDFYEKCIGKIDYASQYIQDPLKGCEMVEVNYAIEWPVNLIIREAHLEMYSELFHLILKIKWALYTLNHLYFNEIEPKVNTQLPKAVTLFLRKLKIFRFHLLNEFSNIQHYILGYVFSKFLRKFEKDFEESYNLDTLIDSHSNFINSLYTVFMQFRDLNDKSHGFNLLLYIVRKLHMMWKNVKNVSEDELRKYEMMFIKCRDNLDPIIFPRDITIEV